MDSTGDVIRAGVRSSRTPSARLTLFQRLQKLDRKIGKIEHILDYRRKGWIDYWKSAGKTEDLLRKRAELDAKRREVREERKKLC